MSENLTVDAASNSAGQPNATATDLLSEAKAPESGAPADSGKPPAEGEKPPAPEAKDGKPADEAKKADEKPAGAPEKYEFKGENLDPDFVKAYGDVAKELDLPQEKAQALIDKIGPVLQERQLSNLNALKTQWAEESRADKEFGGDKLNESLALAKGVLEKHASPGFRELVTVAGLGNHPEFIRFLRGIGQRLSEDSIQTGRSPNGTGASLGQKLYPNQNKKK